ncbi:MAG: hypothetical protein AB8B96_02215 [Lysobacterales bacterium]
MKTWTLLIAALLGTSQVAADTVVKTKRGYAEDAESGALIYIEEHEQTVEDGKTVSQIIRYRDPDGEVFAEKNLDFRQDVRRPLFTLEDRRRNYREGLRFTGGALEVFCFEEGEERAKAVKKKIFVADAGFDRIIETDWDTLISGKTLKFDFLVPAQEGTVKFRLKKTDELSLKGVAAVEFTMAPANGLIRWLVDPIKVVYDIEEKSLLQYRGISNLRDADLNNYDVMIKFPPDERKQVTDALASKRSAAN